MNKKWNSSQRIDGINGVTLKCFYRDREFQTDCYLVHPNKILSGDLYKRPKL